MVDWPRTQPSLYREDEGPTALVPQHMEEEPSEATIPEPFDIGEEAKETQVRQVVDATPEWSLKATSEPSAPVVNLPSPQPAVDPSTPLLEMSEDPTTPVLAMDTSPPTNPVLQLSDEEDGQAQDTQDQSQEFWFLMILFAFWFIIFIILVFVQYFLYVYIHC